MLDLIGQQLGQYQIVAPLGSGGMATVYRARQQSIQREVAVKVIRPDFAQSADFLKRFDREAQTVAALSHPHILKIFDYGQHENTVYLVMELLTGGSLAGQIHEGQPLSLDKTGHLIAQISSALDYAQQRSTYREKALTLFSSKRDEIEREAEPSYQLLYARALWEAGIAPLGGKDIPPTLAAYRHAFQRCSAPGYVRLQHLYLQALMGVSGGERLQPALDLLS